MYKKTILLFSSLFLLSCVNVNVISNDPTDIDDSEDESESLVVSNSDASSSQEKIEHKISLFDASSHLYAVNDNEEESPFLKTYHHKDYNDVPYVDLDEFQHVRRYIDASLKYHNLVKREDGRYDLSSSFNGHCYFDVKNQSVELTEVEALYGEFGPSNGNNIYYDPCLDYKPNGPSSKSKYLQKGEKVTYALDDYQMEIVEENHHLYVPFSLASHLLVNPMGYALSYNGHDFYNSKLLTAESNLIRPYSNKDGFLWSYAGDMKTRTHFARVTPKQGEAYRFEGEIVGLKGSKDPVSAVFKEDGTLTFLSEDLMESVNVTGTWTLKNSVITATLTPQDGIRPNEVQHIDLREGSYYHVESRSQAMAKAHYYQLCMDFDYQYGLKSFLGIKRFDEEFIRLGIKEKLLSLDYATYYDALSRFLIGGKMGDGHTTLVHEGFASCRPSTVLGSEYASVSGERIDKFHDGVSKASQAKSKLDGLGYHEENQTAVISIPAFSTSLSAKFLGIDHYVIPEGTSDIAKFIDTEMNQDTVKGVCYALNQAKKNSKIKNICFDVGLNRGGYVMLVPFISAVMTDDPMMIYENSISGSRIESHYKVDLNGDGVYGGAGDTWKGLYHFFILQGSGSFSAGNIFPTTAKNGGYATTIGEPTLGGGCGIARRTDITGYQYQYNGNIGFPERQSDGSFKNSEGGATPMVEMPLSEAYDLKTLDAKLAELNAKAS